ncbi:isochorismatase family protein [Actinokineospora sp. NBRC 105648]|uniref:isochorismatase family protein n=1 Tax=Actinokineospora sp. NBRC 105648 TaxID=3032206 RepID=UPI0024A34D6D|nr:isochorismatase family protein [Actinokineospora sp. NBRC 105648]GLZ36596.1 phenazine biosynthesis protein PhzD [Actinokineospora sp. NBRC 105648]
MAGIPSIEPYPMPRPESLPENTAAWTADPERTVLLVHDMQRFFLRPFDVMPEFRDELVGNVALLLAHARALDVPVAYTAQPGDMTAAQRGLLADFWGPGMRVSPQDREIVAPLAPRPRDWLLTKWRYSAFFQSDLLARMRASGRDQLVLCGVYAHVGVQATAVDAFTNDVRVFLVSDAVGDFSERDHRQTLEYSALNCAVVTTTAAVTAPAPEGARR